MKRKRSNSTVVTGMGVVSPLGIGLQENWVHLQQGKSGIDKISLFDASNLSTRFAGEVDNFNPLEFIDKKKARQYDRFIHLSIAAGDLALQDAGISPDELPADRTGILVGSGMGG